MVYNFSCNDFLDPESMHVLVTIVNPTNNDLRSDCSLFESITISVAGQEVERINSYHILETLLNDFTFKTNYYRDNNYRPYKNYHPEGYTIKSKTNLRINSSNVIESIEDPHMGISNGKLHYKNDPYILVKIPIISTILGKNHTRTTSGPVLPGRKSPLFPAFLLQEKMQKIQIKLVFNEFAFFAPITEVGLANFSTEEKTLDYYAKIHKQANLATANILKDCVVKKIPSIFINGDERSVSQVEVKKEDVDEAYNVFINSKTNYVKMIEEAYVLTNALRVNRYPRPPQNVPLTFREFCTKHPLGMSLIINPNLNLIIKMLKKVDDSVLQGKDAYVKIYNPQSTSYIYYDEHNNKLYLIKGLESSANPVINFTFFGEFFPFLSVSNLPTALNELHIYSAYQELASVGQMYANVHTAINLEYIQEGKQDVLFKHINDYVAKLKKEEDVLKSTADVVGNALKKLVKVHMDFFVKDRPRFLHFAGLVSDMFKMWSSANFLGDNYPVVFDKLISYIESSDHSKDIFIPSTELFVENSIAFQNLSVHERKTDISPVLIYHQVKYKDPSIKEKYLKEGLMIECSILDVTHKTTQYSLLEQYHHEIYNTMTKNLYFFFLNGLYQHNATMRLSNRYSLNLKDLKIKINKVMFPQEKITKPCSYSDFNQPYLDMLSHCINIEDSNINNFNFAINLNTCDILTQKLNGINLPFINESIALFKNFDFNTELIGKCIFGISFDKFNEMIGKTSGRKSIEITFTYDKSDLKEDGSMIEYEMYVVEENIRNIRLTRGAKIEYFTKELF